MIPPPVFTFMLVRHQCSSHELPSPLHIVVGLFHKLGACGIHSVPAALLISKSGEVGSCMHRPAATMQNRATAYAATMHAAIRAMLATQLKAMCTRDCEAVIGGGARAGAGLGGAGGGGGDGGGGEGGGGDGPVDANKHPA